MCHYRQIFTAPHLFPVLLGVLSPRKVLFLQHQLLHQLYSFPLGLEILCIALIPLSYQGRFHVRLNGAAGRCQRREGGQIKEYKRRVGFGGKQKRNKISHKSRVHPHELMAGNKIKSRHRAPPKGRQRKWRCGETHLSGLHEPLQAFLGEFFIQALHGHIRG